VGARKDEYEWFDRTEEIGGEVKLIFEIFHFLIVQFVSIDVSHAD
jgi:hypothetical protein